MCARSMMYVYCTQTSIVYSMWEYQKLAGRLCRGEAHGKAQWLAGAVLWKFGVGHKHGAVWWRASAAMSGISCFLG